MAIVDISQLDSVCYGIVAFKVRYLKYVTEAEFDNKTEWGRRFSGDPVIEDDRPQRAMSAAEYRAQLGTVKYERSPRDDELDMLENTTPVDGSAMEIIWPKIFRRSKSSSDDEGLGEYNSVEYVLVRCRVGVDMEQPVLLSAGDLDVCSLGGFLALRAPHVDGALVGRRVRELNERLADEAQQREDMQGTGETVTSRDRARVLEPEDAATVFEAFLREAPGWR
ncbi:hypothetical protein B0T24DRAFT_612918 [Lasiosphaeria ovina]|uniref:Uncharacterized protein n=1 Tax=Lasiosphaeria ovina TaxID=92902 RepID=A0AAE0NDZ3_9PEZI|nr:hypothetical protein B0T24DRAFT_612918 [Lasiosphaeria ovina]